MGIIIIMSWRGRMGRLRDAKLSFTRVRTIHVEQSNDVELSETPETVVQNDLQEHVTNEETAAETNLQPMQIVWSQQ